MNKYLKSIKLMLLVILFIYSTGTLYAGDNIVVQLRLYEGFDREGAPSGVIVSSYYLQKLPGDNIIPFVETAKEKKAIMNIYKLKDVKQIAGMDVVLKKGKADKIRQELPLNGRKLTLQLDNVPGKKDRFNVRVLESPQKKKPLLETEIIMPEKKTAVLGFKDSAEKIYFLAFSREKDRAVIGAKKIVKPKLLKFEQPAYPAAALKKKLEGGVLLEGSTDVNGNVVRLQVLAGDPILAAAAEKAGRKWKYSTWKIDGVSKPLNFVFIFIFQKEGGTMGDEKWLKQYLTKNESVLEKNKKERRIMEAVLITGKF
ncbi:MAG: hypothetical protein GY950_17485 [bacterium]|nr:hypothetical protein [bacterium]